MPFAEVAVNAAAPLRQTFTYRVPDGLAVAPGHAVYVPFGARSLQGVVIRIRRRGPGSIFTVRRVSHGVGVERSFPYYSPLIERVEVVRVGRVRRAKLYYLRERVGKAARIRAGSRERFEALAAARS